MSDNTQFESMEKAEDNDIMAELVQVVADTTGAYSDLADEIFTVHIGGRTADYSPRNKRPDHRTDPVLHYVQESESLRIRRTASSSRRSIDGEVKETPRFTIEVTA